MKKLLLFLLIFAAGISTQAIAACGFESVVIDGCCVTFEVVENGFDYEVEMGDGTVLTSSGEHCYSGNGNYALVLTYFKDGVPRCGATYNIEITDCSGVSCDDCGLDPGEIITESTSDPCTFRFTNWGPSVISPCEIVEGNWTSENGTITEIAGGLFAQIVFDSPGTYEVCVDVVASTGTESCVEQVCTDVTVSDDCGGVSCDDCGLDPGEIITESTSDPCTFRFTDWGSGVVSPCEIVDRNWTSENGTITEIAGGLFAQIVFDSPGTYEVCVDVVASTGTESCVEQVCTDVTVSDDCGGVSCDDCGLDPGEIITESTSDPCTFRFTDWGSGVVSPCEIVDRNWTSENGTITEIAGGLFAQIVFDSPGTYEVCVDVVASTGTEICVEQVCTDVTVSHECDTGCDDICKLNPGSIKEHFAPAPCTRLVSNYGSSVHFPCQIVDRNWTAENGTATELAGGIFAQITFNGPGTHEVCVDVVASDGTQTCIETVCTDVVISEECIECDGIDDRDCNEGARVEQIEFIQANVYPNPANQYITFEVFAFEETEAQISLLNSQGQVVRSYTQQFAANTTQFTVNDLNTLSEGVYFYHIQLGSHAKTGKISIFK